MSEEQVKDSVDERLRTLLPTLIGGVTEGGHVGFNSAFLNKGREVEEQGDHALAADLKLLTAAFSMYLRFADGKSEFAPLVENFQQGKRSAIPSDFTDQELDRLVAVLDFSHNPRWVARIADLLWIRRRNHVHARRAIQAYLKCAEKMDEHWPEQEDYLRRAAHLASELGKTSAEREAVSRTVMAAFQEGKKDCYSRERGYLPAALAKIIVECRLTTDWEGLAQQCEEIARGFSITPGCDEPRAYYEIAAKCYRLAGKEDVAKTAELAIAKHWEDEYEVMAKAGASGMILANRLEEAVKAYRKVGGQQEKVDRLIQLWKQANTLAMGQMKEISIPLPNVNPVLQRVRQMMESRTGDDAVRGFLGLHRPQSYDKTVEDVKRSAKEHPLQAMIGRSILAEEGNQVAKVPGMLEDQDAALTAAVVSQYNLGQGLVGSTTLEQARRVIAQGADKSWQESIKQLVAASSFVPEGKREIYQRGLIAGFEGDGIAFAHIIVPQLEDLLRRQFQAFGFKTTTVSPEGVQGEYDLNRLLRDPNAEALLGKDTLWEMRSALIEKSGWNMRNRVCHGLTEAEDFDKPSINVVLWLALFLLVTLHGPDTLPPGKTV